jgi:hypothetical protein
MTRPKLVKLFFDALRTLAFFVLISLALIGYGIYQFGSVGAFIAMARGNALHIEPAELFVGEVELGKSQNVSIRLRNLTSKRLKVLGSETSCGCAVSGDELPVVLEPYQVKPFQLKVLVVNSAQKELDADIAFIDDVDALTRRPKLHVRGNVAAPGSH